MNAAILKKVFFQTIVSGFNAAVRKPDMGGMPLADEVETAVKQAAGKHEVLLIRLKVGRGISVSKAELARELHLRFQRASIEMDESDVGDSVIVKDIEVG